MKKKLALGIDLGGTSTKLGIVDSTGEIIGLAGIPTRGRPEEMARAIAEAYRRMGRRVAVCGAGVPGPLTPDRNVIVDAVNIAGWKKVPFRRLLAKHLKMPVVLENDANVAGFGEFRAGAGKGARSVVLYTLGTGVGGGIVVDGRLVLGDGGFGAELGHVPVELDGEPCGCGRRGCLEAYASSRALQRKRGEGLTAKEIFEEARRGVPKSARIIGTMCKALGAAIAGIAHTLNPSVVILSGGISLAGEFLLRRVRKEARDRMFPGCAAMTKIVLGKLGDRAGVVGAALWGLEKYGNG